MGRCVGSMIVFVLLDWFVGYVLFCLGVVCLLLKCVVVCNCYFGLVVLLVLLFGGLLLFVYCRLVFALVVYVVGWFGIVVWTWFFGV